MGRDALRHKVRRCPPTLSFAYGPGKLRDPGTNRFLEASCWHLFRERVRRVSYSMSISFGFTVAGDRPTLDVARRGTLQFL